MSSFRSPSASCTPVGAAPASSDAWIINPQSGLLETVQAFKAALPGWWYSVGECSVSCDASCGPDRTGPDKHLLPWSAGEDRLFDDGFHADLPNPSTLADALRDVMHQALEAKRALQAAD